MIRIATRITMLTICCGMIASCDGENETVSSSETGGAKKVVTKSASEPVRTAEEIRIQEKLARQEEERAAEELRIEEKLKAEAEKKDAELKALAGQVESRERRSTEELEHRLSRMKAIFKENGSDEVLTGSVESMSK